MRGADGLFDCSLSSVPGRNLTTFLAAIRIGAPLRGSRPVRACFLSIAKVPNPARVTFSPLMSAAVVIFMKASRLLFASPLDIPASEEMDSINCVLFILSRSCDGDTDGSAGRGHVAARSTK